MGIRLADELKPRRRKTLLLCSLTANLGLLFCFKYFDFFRQSLVDLLAVFGAQANLVALDVVLPVGISFYTFQTLSYTIDVYRGELEPRCNVVDFALFVAFFPQLVAGPIVRARDFLPQLDGARRLADIAAKPLLLLFLLGFIKKACISDTIAPFVDQAFANPSDHTALGIWLGVILYSLQIYCDFSGYSDMAIAIAGLLGYQLAINFNAPYLATSLVDFWRRWHISLSTWLRDYLYIPLGGNRHGRSTQYRNVIITMALGGLWHGASWNFVIWGLLHGVALITVQEARRRSPRGARLPVWLGASLTLYWVGLTWIFFRAATLAQAVEMTRAYVFFDSPGTQGLPGGLLLLVGVAAAGHIALRRWPHDRIAEALPGPVFAAVLGAVSAIALGLMQADYRPFIYFQF